MTRSKSPSGDEGDDSDTIKFPARGGYNLEIGESPRLRIQRQEIQCHSGLERDESLLPQLCPRPSFSTHLGKWIGIHSLRCHGRYDFEKHKDQIYEHKFGNVMDKIVKTNEWEFRASLL